MPELPEVETMRRGIAHLQGRRIVGIELPRSQLKSIAIEPGVATFRRRTVGRSLQNFLRRGKRVVVQLDDTQVIVFEPRMTGLVLVTDPPNQEHLRMRIRFDRRPDLLYWDRRGLGSVRLFDCDTFEARLGPEQLGPDALEVTPEILAARFGERRREIKVALLDQQLIAGIGNLYASEILHVASIRPTKRCDQLRRQEWSTISEAILTVLQEAIRYEGSTLSDGTYRNALNKSGGYQNHHRVYDRHDRPCPRCKAGKITRIVQAQRSTFYCPRCQR